MQAFKNPLKIIVILGPTASGKSSAAIKLARKFDGEIISADSRQIYRGMDIGTGKIQKDLTPTLSLSGRGGNNSRYYSDGILHHMIDIISPKTNFSAAQFKKKTDKIIQDILSRGKLPIICGGTGFWIKAIVDDVIYPEVKPNWKLRKKLQEVSAEELFAMLKKMDPRRAENIDAKNKVRMIRAIEICKSLGKVPNTKYELPNTKYKFLQIGILREKEELHKRIENNIKKRFSQGMIEEVERLRREGLSWKKIQSFGLSYNLIPQYLKGEIESKKELFEKIFQAEKDYAKRQMTWFKRDSQIKWLTDYKKIKKETEKFLKNSK